MLVGVRDRLIRNRTQLSNAIRGYAAEFSLTAAKGLAYWFPLLDRIQADESLLRPGSRAVRDAGHGICQLQGANRHEVDAKLMALPSG